MPGYDNAFVQVNRISANFGPIEAVREVSFDVTKGTIFGIVGSDGAGKSTLLRMIATMIRPSAGSILIDGVDVLSEKTRIKHLIGYMPQRFGLYQDLTVDENMDFFMDIFNIKGQERKKRREKYLGFSNLLPFTDRRGGGRTGGSGNS